jgi:hypothetical protein
VVPLCGAVQCAPCAPIGTTRRRHSSSTRTRGASECAGKRAEPASVQNTAGAERDTLQRSVVLRAEGPGTYWGWVWGGVKGRRRAGRALCCPGIADWVGEGYRSGTPCPSLLMVRRAFAHLVFKDATRAARSDAANNRGVVVFHKLKLEPHLPWAVWHGLSLRALRILCSALKRRDRIGPGHDGDRRDRQAGGS